MKFLFDKIKTKKGGKKLKNKTKINTKKKINIKSKKNNKKKVKRNKTPKKVLFKNLNEPVYYEKTLETNLEKDTSKKPKLVLIYAEWCSHCQAMKPNWDEMKSGLLNDNIYNTNDIIEIESNEQEEELSKINHLVTNGPKINVNGYPTMGKIVEGGFKQYIGGRTTDDLLNWAKAK